MPRTIKMVEKYERNNWPSIPRPDVSPPPGWTLAALTALKRVRNHQLSPDGNRISFIWDTDDLSEIYQLPACGGWPQPLSVDRAATLFWNDEIPQWSPDGTWLAYTAHSAVQIVPAAGGLPRPLSEILTGSWSPRWMPDSRHLIINLERHGADQLALLSLDGATLRQLTPCSDGDHWDARPAPDGNSLAFVWRPFDDLNRMDICLLDLASGEIRSLYGHPKTRAWSPRWSPDGAWLAFLSQQNGHDDIWLIRPDGSSLHPLPRPGGEYVEFAWSPDGQSLAACLNRAGSHELCRIHLATGEYQSLRSQPGLHSKPNWGPDGSFITFEYESPTCPPDLYRLQLDSGALTRLTNSTPPWLAAVKRVMPQPVSYPSFDGLTIPALLFPPEKPNGAALVSVHGGPSAQYNLAWDDLLQYFVAKGYTVLAPNYRGSTGYGVEFEHLNYGDWGGGDQQDCLYAADYLKTLPGLDPARLAILGGSYGGYMTNCCLARDPLQRYACGISKYGDGDLVNSWALCSRELRYYTEIFLGHPAKNRAAYDLGSPIRQVAAIQKPMLILHGLRDDIVPPEASEAWVEALKREGKAYEYKTYPTEPHGFVHRGPRLDAYERMEQFLDWFLFPFS